MFKDKAFIITIVTFSLLLIIVGLQGTVMHRVLAVTSDLNNTAGYGNTQGIIVKNKNNDNNILLLSKILAKNLVNHIQKAGAILEVTSKLPQEMYLIRICLIKH